ncbi:hypothetical protein [Plesiocystis pacifica]|uniref:hypothetical protein n=1 Tax=Plesiocystis pacifica TaxID=191768 RepID=UPI0002EB1036|nr:hypothetical protein [Plesiocystis pacifica]
MPVNLALEDLEQADFETWEELELPETHFEWALVEDIQPEQRARQLEDVARDLWSVAVLWTRAKGPVCDFQIRGYGSEDTILFEDGKRCNLSGERSRYDDGETRERAPIDEAIRGMIGDERAAWLQLDRVKDTLIDRLNGDREKLFEHLERVNRAAPETIENAHGILDRALQFQQRAFDNLVSQEDHTLEIRLHAITEHNRTQRVESFFKFVKDVGDSAVGALPTIQSTLEGVVTGARTLPRFRVAQDALRYLKISLEPERLAMCFHGMPSEKRKAADEVMTTLKRLSKTEDENTALAGCGPLVDKLFKTRIFREVATRQEQFAAEFIMGKLATERIILDDY